MEQNNIEIWKPVVGYEGRYEVSSFGRVKSLPRVKVRRNGSSQTIRGGMLELHTCRKGYQYCALSTEGKGKQFWVHRLVCLAFNGPPAPAVFGSVLLSELHVNHKNLDKTDNTPGNLEWCTHAQNMAHAQRLGVFSPLKGRKGPFKLTPEIAEEIRREVGLCKRSRREIAESMGIPMSAFQAAATGFTWSLSPTPVGNRANKSYADPFKHPGKRKKLNPEQVAEIRSLRGTPVSALAEKFKVSDVTIRKILKGVSWVIKEPVTSLAPSAG